MMHIPDPKDYQQLDPIGKYGQYNCTAEGAAFRTEAHSYGAIKVTGEQVRAHSDEPVPDRDSPGLNLGQVDASVIELTNGRVNFDTRVQGRSLPRAEVKARIQDQKFCGLSIRRSVLVNRGFVTGFTGLHDITAFTRPSEPDVPVFFDPLVPYLIRASWDALFDAAESATPGHIYAQFTRDVTPDYRVVIKPRPGTTTKAFYQFILDDHGKITRMVLRQTRGTNVRCSVPSYHAGARPAVKGRYLVQLQEGDVRRGWWVNAHFAEEINP